MSMSGKCPWKHHISNEQFWGATGEHKQDANPHIHACDCAGVPKGEAVALLCGLMLRMVGPAMTLYNIQAKPRIYIVRLIDRKQRHALRILCNVASWYHFGCREGDEDLGETAREDQHSHIKATTVSHLQTNRNDTLRDWSPLCQHFDLMLTDDGLHVKGSRSSVLPHPKPDVGLPPPSRKYFFKSRTVNGYMPSKRCMR
jgi:hypothetical protein